MKKNVRRGFTLPEILVTVTVIAVLAAVVVPAVTQYVNKGDAPATSGDIGQVRSAITSYVADTRHYPTDFSDLVNQTSGVASWKGPYFAGALAGVSGVSATFLSNGSGITLGPAFTQSNGYLTTTVSLASGATCQDLWNLDRAIDGSTATQANATTNSTSGTLQWSTTCDSTVTGGTSASAVTSIVLQLTPIGT
jgi:type IV pilus assembly protein PilE